MGMRKVHALGVDYSSLINIQVYQSPQTDKEKKE